MRWFRLNRFSKTLLPMNKQTLFPYLLLFGYFGVIIIPQLFRPFSPVWLVWLMSLPVVLLTLLGIGLWGIVGIIQAKRKWNSPLPRNVSFTRLSVAALLCFGISIGLAYGTQYLYNHKKFNAMVWQNPRSSEYIAYNLTPRQRMVDDLVNNFLPGKTQEEIEANLGPSLNTGYFSGTEESFIYVLGPERGFGVDYEWLLIWVDDAGCFERFEITTD